MLALLAGLKARTVAAAAVLLAVLAAAVGLHRAGRRAERARTLERNAEIRNAQLDAAMDRPRTDDELDRRLRSGGF